MGRIGFVIICYVMCNLLTRTADERQPSNEQKVSGTKKEKGKYPSKKPTRAYASRVIMQFWTSIMETSLKNKLNS